MRSLRSPERAYIVGDFKRAWEDKDINVLIRMVDPDATATGDSGDP